MSREASTAALETFSQRLFLLEQREPAARLAVRFVRPVDDWGSVKSQWQGWKMGQSVKGGPRQIL